MTAIELSNKPVLSRPAGSSSRGRAGAYLCALCLVLGGSACRQTTAVTEPGKDHAIAPRPVTADTLPKINDPSFTVERFAVMPTETPAIFDAMDPDGPGQQRAFWTMVLSDGSQGFPKGILATTGPFPGVRSDRIYLIDPKGTVGVLLDGLAGSQQLIWATGKYRQAGDLLVAEPISGQIRAIGTGGRKITVLADLAPVVPSGLTIGPDIFGQTSDEVLYATDLGQTPGQGAVWRIPPPGSTEKPQKLSDVSLPKLPDSATPAAAAQLLRARKGNYAGLSIVTSAVITRSAAQSRAANAGSAPSLLAFTWSISSLGLLNSEPLMNIDNVISITPGAGGLQGKAESKAIHGRLNAVMFPSFGPGSPTFGSSLYLPMLGSPSKDRNGSVAMVNGDKRSDFITNLHATSVVFDDQGVLGVPGAMYVAAFDPYVPGEIWRVAKK